MSWIDLRDWSLASICAVQCFMVCMWPHRVFVCAVVLYYWSSSGWYTVVITSYQNTSSPLIPQTHRNLPAGRFISLTTCRVMPNLSSDILLPLILPHHRCFFLSFCLLIFLFLFPFWPVRLWALDLLMSRSPILKEAISHMAGVMGELQTLQSSYESNFAYFYYALKVSTLLARGKCIPFSV